MQQVLAGPVTLSLRATVNGLSLYGTSNGTIAAGSTATGIDVQLQDTGTVTGVVMRDAAGTGFESALGKALARTDRLSLIEVMIKG